MLSVITKSLAVLASIQAAAGLAVPQPESNTVIAKRATGPVNAVYFTNW